MVTIWKIAMFGVGLLLAGTAAAQGYPSRSIHVSSPVQAGSAGDTSLRILTQKMAENMGQAIAVENLPGAAGMLGADRLAQAVPDGYTIGGISDSTLTYVPIIQRRTGFDPLAAFEPVSFVAESTWVLIVHPSLPAARPAAPLLFLPGWPALTFGDLREQIRHVRACLRSRNFAPGDIITGCIDSRPHMALACLSLPAASTFAPVSPSLPEEGYSTLLARLRPTAVLVDAASDHPLRAAATKRGIAEIRVTADPDAAPGRFRIDLSAAGDSDGGGRAARADFAYVLVTSGTTGPAKLVPVAHRQMLAFARTMIDWLRLKPDDIGCTMSPLHLAGGLRATLLIPLLSGGSVICLAEADTEGFFRAIDEFRPTYLSAGFAIHRAILRQSAGFPEQVARSRLRFLRTTAGRLEPDEIAVRGPLVFDGYLDAPELTARSLVGGWFRTGDLGWIDEDGYVFLSGRMSELINRGGEKISPVEVDGALQSLPGVDEAAAFGVPHPSPGEELVAAVVRAPGATLEEADIIDHVRRRLGSRQAPRRIYFVDRLPRTESGKVRRNALAQTVDLDAGGAQHVTAAAARGAGSPREAVLTQLWSTAFDGRTVGRDDNFFLLGGDSLSGAQLLLRVNAMFGSSLPLKDLFGEAATIAGMARTIERECAPAS